MAPLGLGTTITSIDSAQVYKELSELANYSDLDVHFDFSTLSGAHGDEVTAATNLGAGGSTNAINSNSGSPSVDRTTLSRCSVSFDGTDDVLNMAAALTTTNKAFTFFMVFHKSATDNEIFFTKAVDDEDDQIKSTGSNGNLVFGFQGQSVVTVALASTGGSTVNFTIPAGEPVVIAIRRNTAGSVFIFAQEGLYVATKSNAAIKAGSNFTLGAIGGSTSSATDYTGNMCEVGLYDADIGNTEIEILVKELSRKWGANNP